MRLPIRAAAIILLASLSVACDPNNPFNPNPPPPPPPIQNCVISPISIVDQNDAPLPASTQLNVGEKKTVKVNIPFTGSCPASYFVTTWFSTAPTSVKVTKTGPVTAEVEGLAPAATIGISVNIPGIDASAMFSVVAGPFDHITISPANPTLAIGSAPRQFSVEFRDINNFLTTGPAGSVVWSSPTHAVASVSATGLVTVIGPAGSNLVTADFTPTASATVKSASTLVTVVPAATPFPTTLIVTPGTASVAIGTPAVPFTATILDQNGNVYVGGLTWVSLNTSIATIGALSGTITGITTGTATIRAISDGNQSVFGDAQVTITPAPVAPVRIAYAVADQPSAAAYTADPIHQFNGLGGQIAVTRSGTGQYTVTIPGFGGAAGESRLPFVSTLNPSSVECLALSWTMIGVTDATVQVDCSTGGTLTDSRFTIFAIGQGGLPGRLAFAASGPVSSFPAGLGSGFPIALGSASSWSSSGLALQFTRFDDPGRPTGRYLLESRLPGTATRDVPVVRPHGATTARCQLSSWATVLDIPCFPVGAPSFGDAPFSGMLLDQGRAGKRFGAAHSGFLAASVARNSAGGSNTVTPTGTGSWRATFPNLGRPVGGRETVLVTPHALSFGVTCHASSWTTIGTDLAVDVACFTSAGAPTSATDFVVVVIE